MVKTLDLGLITRHAKNVYEATIIIARRARQINIENKIKLERELELEGGNGDFDEEDFEQPRVIERQLNLPKPPLVALEEFLNDELIIEYADENIS
jgi:DNA-directed RNA polymerase subunit K/omega